MLFSVKSHDDVDVSNYPEMDGDGTIVIGPSDVPLKDVLEKTYSVGVCWYCLLTKIFIFQVLHMFTLRCLFLSRYIYSSFHCTCEFSAPVERVARFLQPRMGQKLFLLRWQATGRSTEVLQ